MHRLILALAISSTALSSACLFNLKRDPKAESQALLQKRDLPALEEKCRKGAVSYSPYCEAASNLRYTLFEEQTDCAVLVPAIEKGAGPFVADHFGAGYANYRVVATDKAISCNKPALIFSQLIWPMNVGQPPKAAIDEGKKLGVDVNAVLLAWLAQTPGAFDGEGSSLAVQGLARWLVTPGAPRCAAVLPYTNTKKETARFEWFAYFRETKCAEAIPQLSEALLSNETDTRISACNTLGEIGTSSAAGRMQTLGSTDGVWRTSNQGVKYYPVRDACLAAAGKIALRSK
jgi:hypothetical protein